MEIKEARRWIRILSAYVESRQIQIKQYYDTENYEWKDTNDIILTLPASEYRIKPLPRLPKRKDGENLMQYVRRLSFNLTDDEYKMLDEVLEKAWFEGFDV